MRLWLYCLAGFVFDWVLYVLWTVIPIHAEHLGATPRHLALIQTASSVVYVAMCLVVGRLADRLSKGALLRIGCLAMVGACLLIGRSTSLTALILLVPLSGFAGSLFWPSVQGAIGAESKPETLERSIGLFNILWSTGKALGFMTAGAMHGGLGPGPTLAVAAAGAAAVAIFYPWRDARGEPPKPAEGESRRTYLHIAWVANFVVFGVGSVIANQYFKYIDDHSLGLVLFAGFKKPAEAFFGAYLGTIFLSQTVVFIVMSRTKAWTYRRGMLYVTQVLLAGAAFSLTLLRGDLAILATAPIIGLGLGFGYAGSIYYSLHTPSGHGKYSGIHEAVLGAGNFLLPLAAGELASRIGDLRWPYWLSAGCAIAAIVIEEAVYRKSSSSGNRSMRTSASTRSPGLE